MMHLAELFARLDSTNSTNEKIKVLNTYMSSEDDKAKLSLLALFTGRKPKRKISTSQLREWAVEFSGIPLWLFEEAYHAVGDLAETIALLTASQHQHKVTTLSTWFDELHLLSEQVFEKKKYVFEKWRHLSKQEIWLFNKLLTGGLRIGISQALIIKSISEIEGIDTAVITHRITGNWDFYTISYHDLILRPTEANISAPYPFLLADTLDDKLMLSQPSDLYQAEWKWDGIRAQIIYRNRQKLIWSRGEELITDSFPDLHAMIAHFPDGVVLDGELICTTAVKDPSINPLPFAFLQKRLGRKKISKTLMQQAPAAFIAYDVLEYNHEDIRSWQWKDRRTLLEKIYEHHPDNSTFKLSPLLKADSWSDMEKLRQQSRTYKAEGIMLKNKESTYGHGRKKGIWLKWKIDPLTVDAVLVYAQKGHGRRADLYSNYTFALWDQGKLVTFTKAYSGLTDAEMKEVDWFIKNNTLEKFGPVRTVKPELVFEVGFEAIQVSNRHKSGFAVRFPRMVRWRRDKKAHEADTIAQLSQLYNG
jgi:DNA ligase-1